MLENGAFRQGAERLKKVGSLVRASPAVLALTMPCRNFLSRNGSPARTNLRQCESGRTSAR